MREPVILRNFREYDYDALKGNLKFYFFFVVIAISLFLLAFQIIQIRIFGSSREFNFLFTIMNSLIFGAYFNLLGIFNTGIRNRNWKLLILAIILIIILLGFTYLNIVIVFNFWFLAYNVFSTASVDGIYFFIYNEVFWLILYGASFLIESEV